MVKDTKPQIDPHDSYSMKIGLLTPVIAIFLSAFTIFAHRSHNESIILQNEANHLWSYYQAKRTRDYQLQLNTDMITVLAPSSAQVSKLLEGYALKHEQYAKDLAKLQEDASVAEEHNLIVQRKALYFNLSEGMLETSLVLSSLYFVAKRKVFPLMGIFFGIIGLTAGVIGLLL